MAVQRRNSEMVSLLSPDFVLRSDLESGLVGGIKILEKTASYPVVVADYSIGDILFISVSSASATTITLPTIATAQNTVNTTKIIVKNINTGTVTIDGNGAETIDGSTTRSLSVKYETLAIVAGTTEWHII